MSLASSPALLPPPRATDPCEPVEAAPGQVVGSSFRDPSGFLFWRDGELFRQVNRSYAADYEHLCASGLCDELVEAGLLVPHEEVDEPACDAGEGLWHGLPARERHGQDGRATYKVIRPRRLAFISYPYEWCFSQLKDAALTTLRIQRRAMARGMWLKDASAYNVQLDAAAGDRQVLIDTLSLERYPEGQPWVAYRQFCQHFLAPLALMAHCDARLGQLLRIHLDGVPLDLASRLLPWRTRFSPGLLLHLHTHARMHRRHAASPTVGQPTARFSRRSLGLLIDSLERLVAGLKYRGRSSTWGDYYASLHNYAPESLAAKEQLVGEILDQSRPRTVWDLGANDGRFSRLAARRGALTICWDIDPLCVERNYLAMSSERETGLAPLVLDLTNPSPSIGWAHRERMSLAERGPADVVMALGLVHHLAIGNNVPWDRLAEYLARLGRELIVEYVPKEDSQVARMLAARRDVFGEYHQAGFEAAFARHFRITARRPIPGSLRWLYAMRRRRGGETETR